MVNKEISEMEDSSSNVSHVNEVDYTYPYPSHVCAPNFVTTKLTGRDKYKVWKTQMLCLLESHGMLGFIDGTVISPTDDAQSSVSGKEKVGGCDPFRLWKRSDSLVKGWILGSLSEQAIMYVLDRLTGKIHPQTNPDFTSRKIWEELESTYGPSVSHYRIQQDNEAAEITTPAKCLEGDAKEKTKDELDQEGKKEKEKLEAKEKEKQEAKEKLYEAILRGSWEAVDDVLKNNELKVTDKITINGNTALHVAVGTTKKTELIERMLDMVPMTPPSTLLNVQNSDGSTLLHTAAIVGNIDAAKILVDRHPILLSAMDNDCCTPLAKALSNMHTEVCIFLLNSSNPDIETGNMFSGRSGDELLVNAISSKEFSSAMELTKHCRALHSDLVLMSIAQNFPHEPKSWETRIVEWAWDSPDRCDAFCNALDEVICFVKYCLCCCLCMTLYCLVRLVVIAIMKVSGSYKLIKKREEAYYNAKILLMWVCSEIKYWNDSRSHHLYYTNPIMEASRQNAYVVVEEIVSYFPNAIWSVNEDGHNIIQYAVINRSEKVYNLLYQMSEHRNIYRTIKDSFGNNLLHLAGRLAPANKLNRISGAALQVQSEIQWFKEVQGFVCPLNIIDRNAFGETPEMVFTKEHKDLVIEGERWMKTTAESYTITAALIITIAFAAAITVPGGNNQDTGIPIFTKQTAFTIFAVADAISMFTSTTSLLMFLSILTARFAEKDFLYKLPTKLIIGLATLFISTTAMIIAFGATLFLLFGRQISWILIPIGILTSLPIASFVTLQFPLIVELINATYVRSTFGKKRDNPFY